MKNINWFGIIGCTLSSFIGAMASFFIVYYHVEWIKNGLGTVKEWQDFIAAMITLSVGILAYFAVLRQINADRTMKEEEQKAAVKIFKMWIGYYIQDLLAVSRALERQINRTNGSAGNPSGVADFLSKIIPTSPLNISDLLLKCSHDDATEIIGIYLCKERCDLVILEFCQALRIGEPQNRLEELLAIFSDARGAFITSMSDFNERHP